MPSQVILQNRKGFLVLEALIAVAILTMVIPAVVLLGFSSQSLQTSAQEKLDDFSNATDIIANGAYEQSASSSAHYTHQFGRNTCTIVISQHQDFSKTTISVNNSVNIANATATDIIARNAFIYETVDTSQTNPDFFIINTENPSAPFIVSSLKTGPGLANVTVAGHYAYVANESSVSQLVVIDIINRTSPVIVAKLKLPLPTATTTAPHAASIFYENGMVFIGTVKWSGSEFAVIDVSTPTSPKYLGGFDTDTRINSIYADSDINTYAYVADADTDQLRVLDISDTSSPRFLSAFSPSGSSVLEGNVLFIENNILFFGRAGGGFDNPIDYELFSFDLSKDPLAGQPVAFLNVPGGIYGIVAVPGYLFLAVADTDPSTGTNGSIQIWKDDLSSMVYRIPLLTKPISLACDHGRLYVGLSGGQSFGIITP